MRSRSEREEARCIGGNVRGDDMEIVGMGREDIPQVVKYSQEKGGRA